MIKISKFVTILLWVLLLVSAVLVVSMMANITENEADPAMSSWLNTNLIWAYVLMATGAGVAVLAGLFHMVTDISAAKKGLISLVILGAVVVVAYLLSSDTMPQFLGVQRFINQGLTQQTVKLIDTGLIITYILLGLAVLSIVLSPVTRLFD